MGGGGGGVVRDYQAVAQRRCLVTRIPLALTRGPAYTSRLMHQCVRARKFCTCLRRTVKDPKTRKRVRERELRDPRGEFFRVGTLSRQSPSEALGRIQCPGGSGVRESKKTQLLGSMGTLLSATRGNRELTRAQYYTKQ